MITALAPTTVAGAVFLAVVAVLLAWAVGLLVESLRDEVDLLEPEAERRPLTVEDKRRAVEEALRREDAEQLPRLRLTRGQRRHILDRP